MKKNEIKKLSKKVFGYYVDDPSNFNENFKRTRIRKLIPKFKSEGLDERKLKLTIKNLKEADQTIIYYVNKNIKKNAVLKKGNKKDCYILNKDFFKQPNEIIFRSLSDIIRNIGMKYYAVRGKSIVNLISNIKSKKITKSTLGGCIIENVNETVLISRENL